MTPALDAVRAAPDRLRPRVAVVLGSGLGGAAVAFAPAAEAAFADLPGLTAPTVAGHRGRLAVGRWAGVPAMICFGRVHAYEGHPPGRVTAAVRLVADLGVTTLLLTNAAGGIHPGLGPGDLLAIDRHFFGFRPSLVASPYTPGLVEVLQAADIGHVLLAGSYACLLGPSYETPAEIRALQHLGADAVGMSTATEAVAAAGLGLAVAGLSCVTNRAAGLAPGSLSHAEVERAAGRAVGRVAALLGRFLAATG